ncbi:CAP domain-containing protein [Plantactinospora sp. B6F1]|uniref:CAP domain-containing protein n=1 Tax=Plantactinospora sp. B6F1 TaxID=3158971 RepID=UPI0032D99EBA
MQGWTEQPGWGDGDDWPDRADNGAAHPAARAADRDDPSRSSQPSGPADPRLHPDPDWSDQHSEPDWPDQRPDLDWSDQRPDLDWSDQRPDLDWSDQRPDLDWPDQRPEPGWPDQHPEPGWVDEVAERWRRAGLGPVDEPIGRRQQAAARWADEPADLGAFDLGRDADGGRGRRIRSDDHGPGGRAGGGASGRAGSDRGGSGRGSSGRHRRPTPLRGPVGLGIAVTALLGAFGVGAALLPPSLADAPAGDRGGRPAVEAAGPEEATEPATPEPTATPERASTPTPSATPPPRRPRATTTAPKPPRTTSPAARRTRAGSGSAAGTAGSSQQTQVLAIVNRERAANGCAAVVVNSDLAEAAQLHSQDQGEHTNMSHTGSDGSDFVERARRAGYDRPIGENVAMGYENAAAVMDGWMNSSGHRANILNCDARAMGVGVATGSDGRLYWTQMFGAVA